MHCCIPPCLKKEGPILHMYFLNWMRAPSVEAGVSIRSNVKLITMSCFTIACDSKMTFGQKHKDDVSSLVT